MSESLWGRNITFSKNLSFDAMELIFRLSYFQGHPGIVHRWIHSNSPHVSLMTLTQCLVT